MKKSAIIFTAFILLVTTAAFAQDDDWNSKKYQVGEFNKIFLEGSFKVYLIQGKECGLNVKTTNDDVFDDLIVRNENGKIYIKMEREFFRFNRVNLYIIFKQLEQMEIEGGVNLKQTDILICRIFQ